MGTMMQLVPKNWWSSRDFTILDQSIPVGNLDMSAWRERAQLTARGKAYRVYRERMTGPFVLEADGAVLARAEKPSAFRHCFMIAHVGSSYTLLATSKSGDTFLLLDGPREIGSVSPRGLFTRRARVDFPDSLPLPLRVFMIWLVVVLWKRESDSTTAMAMASVG